MPITTESMAAWCRKLLGADPNAPSDVGTIPGRHPANGVSGQTARRHARAGPRRRRRQARPQARRRRHPPAVDERDAQVRPGPGLEADRLRPRRPRAGEIAGQGCRPAGRNPRLRSGLHRRLARSGHRHDQGRGGQDDCPKPAGQRHHAAKHAEIRHRAVALEGQAGRHRPTWPKSWPGWPTSSPRRWPKSTSTRRFRPAASTPPAWSCPPPWKRWPWASTRPSSSTAT